MWFVKPVVTPPKVATAGDVKNTIIGSCEAVAVIERLKLAQKSLLNISTLWRLKLPCEH